MKKLLSMVLVVIMTATMLIGCGGSSEESGEAESSSAEMIKIGVIQYMQHGSLDENYQGFVDGLAEAGYVDGENIEIDFQNASGEVGNCQQICGLFANNETDLVFAIATPAAQAVRILEGKSAADIAVETQKDMALVVNETFAKSVGVEIPADMLDKAATKY